MGWNHWTLSVSRISMVFPNSSLKWENQLHTGDMSNIIWHANQWQGILQLSLWYLRTNVDSVIMMYKVVYNLVHRPLSSSVQQVLKPHAEFSSSNFGFKPLICMSLNKNSVHCILTRSKKERREIQTIVAEYLAVNRKHFKVLPTISALYFNEHLFYHFWHVIDLFLVFVDRNFFIQHSFSIDFRTTTTWTEHS